MKKQALEDFTIGQMVEFMNVEIAKTSRMDGVMDKDRFKLRLFRLRAIRDKITEAK